jgi:putative phosphoesterase
VLHSVATFKYKTLKKIVLISDTHGHFDPKLVKYIQAADEVWHAGDIGDMRVCDEIRKLKPLKAVWGNIDGQRARSEFQEHLIFTCEEAKIYITHIAGYPGKYAKGIKERLIEEKPDVFICGHSHILKVMYDKSLNLLFMNPGACGMSGFHQVKTLLTFEIEGKEIKNLNVIELGSRAEIKNG